MLLCLKNAMHNNSHYRRRERRARNELLIISVTSMQREKRRIPKMKRIKCFPTVYVGHTHIVVNVSCSFITFISVWWWRVQTKCTCTSILTIKNLLLRLYLILAKCWYKKKEKREEKKNLNTSFFGYQILITLNQSSVAIDRINWSIKVEKKKRVFYHLSISNQ